MKFHNIPLIHPTTYISPNGIFDVEVPNNVTNIVIDDVTLLAIKHLVKLGMEHPKYDPIRDEHGIDVGPTLVNLVDSTLEEMITNPNNRNMTHGWII